MSVSRIWVWSEWGMSTVLGTVFLYVDVFQGVSKIMYQMTCDTLSLSDHLDTVVVGINEVRWEIQDGFWCI